MALKAAGARGGALAGPVSLIPLMGLNRVFNLSLDGNPAVRWHSVIRAQVSSPCNLGRARGIPKE